MNDFEKSYREKNKQVKNYGVLLGERPGDYRAGAKVSALPYVIRNESGDWEPKLPLEENQSNDGGDSMSCVTFAELNGVETQANNLLYNRELNDDLIQWSIDGGYIIKRP